MSNFLCNLWTLCTSTTFNGRFVFCFYFRLFLGEPITNGYDYHVKDAHKSTGNGKGDLVGLHERLGLKLEKLYGKPELDPYITVEGSGRVLAGGTPEGMAVLLSRKR